MLSIAPELCDCLCNKNIEPIQAFRLMAVDVVVCFTKDCGSCQWRWVSKDTRAFLIELLGRVTGSRASYGEEGAFVCEGS